MTEKQQFETMATELSNSNERNGLNLCESEVDLLAIDLYNAGYRKVGENAVVLTAEKIAEFETGYRKAWEVDMIQVRKETAKEILDKVSRHYGGAWLVELYKEYGVEVEE